MLDQLREVAARASALRKLVRSVEGPQVRKKSVREEAAAIVDCYFRDVREPARIAGLPSEHLDYLDAQMHSLLEASHRMSTKGTYDTALKSLAKGFLAAEKAALTVIHAPGAASFEATDQLIVDTLARILPSAGRAYEQALRDLTGPDRLSWRGPATDLRESLREVLDHLAPDKDVESQEGFRLEKDQPKPTMKQKVRYILRKRGLTRSASAVPESSAEAVDEIVGGYVRSLYTRSSISTHTPTQREEVHRVHEYVRAAMCELLEVHPSA